MSGFIGATNELDGLLLGGKRRETAVRPRAPRCGRRGPSSPCSPGRRRQVTTRLAGLRAAEGPHGWRGAGARSDRRRTRGARSEQLHGGTRCVENRPLNRLSNRIERPSLTSTSPFVGDPCAARTVSTSIPSDSSAIRRRTRASAHGPAPPRVALAPKQNHESTPGPSPARRGRQDEKISAHPCPIVEIFELSRVHLRCRWRSY
jgi:hypothetical protein